MTFAKWVFRIAGIYGIAILIPFYFLEDKIGAMTPPAITHPEFFYGFLGVGLAWQVAFLIISFNPAKYRLFMVPSMIEKFSYVVATLSLYEQGRLSSQMLPSIGIDLLFLVLFTIVFWNTRAHHVHSLD